MGNYLDELLNAPEGKPAGFAYHCIRLPINRNSILPNQKKRFVPVMHCDTYAEARVEIEPPAEYQAWKTWESSQQVAKATYEEPQDANDYFDVNSEHFYKHRK